MARQFAVGGPFGGGYVVDAEDRDYQLAQSYLAEAPSGGTNVSVTIDATAIGLAISVGTVSVTAVQNVSVNATTNSVTATQGDETVNYAFKVNVDGSTTSATISVGTVTVSAGGNISVNATGNSLAISTSNVTVNYAFKVDATGNSATITAGNVTVNYAFKVSATTNLLTITCGDVSVIGSATTLNPSDKKAGTTLSNGNLTATGTDAGGNNWVRSTLAKTGKRYVEFTINTVNNTVVGIADASTMTFPGSNANSFGLFYNGFGSINGTFPDWGGGAGTPYNTYTTGDVVGMAVDLTAKLVWFRKNGGNWNGSSSNSPTTGVGGISISAYTGTTHYVVVSGNSGHVTTVNFGASAFGTAAPTGFLAWDGVATNVNVSATTNSVAISVGSVTVTAISTISVDATGNALAIDVGTVTHNYSFKVDTTGNAIAISGGTVSVGQGTGVSTTGNSLAISTSTPTVNYGVGAAATTNLLTVSLNSVGFPVHVNVNLIGESLGVGQGTVTVTAAGNVNGFALTISAGSVTVVTVASIPVTMTGLTISSGRATIRLDFGNPLGPVLSQSLASISNPFVASSGQAEVFVGDLIYAVLTEQTAVTVTAMSDNLGNTYTACNAGSDAGAITGRAFYSLVTVSGMLTSVSATCTSSGNNAVMVVQAFQGPFISPPLDANPANAVNTDIISPYVGPSTGTLTQADEMLVAWSTRPDSNNILAVAPLVGIGAFNSSTVIRTNISYQVLASTSTIAPSWTSTVDPTQFLSGATTFKKSAGGVDVDANADGNLLTASAGSVTITIGGVTVNAVGNSLSISTNSVVVKIDVRVLIDTTFEVMDCFYGQVTVSGKANAAAISDQLTISVGNVTFGSIYLGLTAGVTDGVYGSGGTFPTGWQVDAFGVNMTIVGHGYDDSVEYFDLQIDGTPSGILHQVDLYFPGPNFGGQPATTGEVWRVGSYQKLMAGSLVSNTLNLFGTTSATGSPAETYTDTTAPASSGAYQLSYREVVHVLTSPSTNHATGAMRFKVGGSPASATIRIAAKLSTQDIAVSVTSPPMTITCGTATVTVPMPVNAGSQFMLITAGDVTVRCGVGASPAAMPALAITAGNATVFTMSGSAVTGNVLNISVGNGTPGNVTVTGKANVTIAAVPGMTISTSNVTIAAGVGAIVTAMPAMTISTATAGGVTITAHASIMVTGMQLTCSIGGNAFVPQPSLPYQREGRMLTASNWMGA